MNRYLTLLAVTLLGCSHVIAQPSTPSRTEAGRTEQASPQVDVSTLTGKVMCGYQGWFNCPGDGQQLGWTHWAQKRGRDFAPGNVTVDIWPDVSELDDDERFATGFRHADGRTAEVFSSANGKTVARHFRWMQDHGIDGVFLQRFANGLRRESFKRHKDVVLENVREAAGAAGRSYAVMYDLSGLPSGGVKIVGEDWKVLRHELGVTNDPSYQRHEGKPVVAVWGVGFDERDSPRKYSLRECRELIKSLKSDGCTVMLGVPTGWRKLERDATADRELHEVIQLADVVSPWTVGRYQDVKGVSRHAEKYWKTDRQWCDEREMDYMPVIFPGFSWHNLKGEKLGAIPRRKGQFLWSQVDGAIDAGCEMIYVAMFDEVDEGTAVFKCTNDPPSSEGASFLDYEGLPSDHYLKLVGDAGKRLRNATNSK